MGRGINYSLNLLTLYCKTSLTMTLMFVLVCVCLLVCAGVVVTQLSATDADSGANGWLLYRLESGAQDRFVVDSLSGAVLVGNASLDREERASYRLIVMATDRGTPPLSATATLTVVLDDVNDSRPRFIRPVQTISVNESTPPGEVVATLTAEDPDLRPRLEYYIISVEARDDANKPVRGLQESFGIEFHTGECSRGYTHDEVDALVENAVYQDGTFSEAWLIRLIVNVMMHFLGSRTTPTDLYLLIAYR